jgi:hypothetical protein
MGLMPHLLICQIGMVLDIHLTTYEKKSIKWVTSFGNRKFGF